MVDRCPIDGPTFLVMVGRNTQAPKPNKPSNLVLLLFLKRLFGKETILQKLRGDVRGDVSTMSLPQVFEQSFLPSITILVSFI
jgi:hypothetical protein